MLTPTEIEAINELSEPTKAIFAYALKSFNTDIKNIERYCNEVDPGNAGMQAFHENVLRHSNALLKTVELFTFNENPLSLIEHFAPKN